ncbi:MAG: CoB--CoM heterodisulfide reductase iron-sulfur subunit A family protein [Dehalococcoidia bacterium]|nr:MAG: CoB--CoM heterodisulfide reductase iron-sulfur subunit A family protein [Dehalococcoidia bacterium]
MAKKIGVYVCECGANIAEKVDIDKVIAAVSPLKDVEVTERHKLLCSEGGKEFLKQSIEEHGLTHVVVAACSPKQHELTFMNVCGQAGLNPQLFQLANIREQCAWVTPDGEEATDKAIRQIRAAISRVLYHAPLEKKEVEVSPDVLVIGGGIAGIKASQLLAAPDRKVYLVEKTSSLGGKVKNFSKLFTNMESGLDLIAQELQSLVENENIEVLTDSEVEQILGFLGNFEVKVVKKVEDKELNFNVGAVILATGFELFDPKGLPQYGYGKLDNIYTSLEFEEMNIPDGPTGGKILLKNGKPPESVAIIHCVGRKEKDYCSKVCCLYSLKFDRMLKSQLPAVKVSHLYSDLCIPGKSFQKFYEDTRKMEIEFVRSSRTEVTGNGKGTTIKYETETGSKGDLAADMVILIPAMESSSDAQKFAEMLNIPQDERGFLAEEHQLLGPVASAVEGVFVIGCAQGPQSISESIVQAEAAAGKILSALVPGRKLELEVRTSEISENFCLGCKICIDVCPYGAITFDEMRRISVVNEVLCHGCGSCAAACPSGAAKLRHSTFPQIYQELKEVLR